MSEPATTTLPLGVCRAGEEISLEIHMLSAAPGKVLVRPSDLVDKAGQIGDRLS
jgi:hypothetical protein